MIRVQSWSAIREQIGDCCQINPQKNPTARVAFITALAIAILGTIAICAVPGVPDVAKIALGSSMGGIAALTLLYFGKEEWRYMSTKEYIQLTFLALAVLGTLTVMATPGVPDVAKMTVAGVAGVGALIGLGATVIRDHEIKLYLATALAIAILASIAVCAIPQVPDMAKIALGTSVGAIAAMGLLYRGHSMWRSLQPVGRLGFALFVIAVLGTLAVMAAPGVPDVAKISIAGAIGATVLVGLGWKRIDSDKARLVFVASLAIAIMATVVVCAIPQVSDVTKIALGSSVGGIAAMSLLYFGHSVWRDFGRSLLGEFHPGARLGIALLAIVVLGTLAVMAIPQVPDVAKISIAGVVGGSSLIGLGWYHLDIDIDLDKAKFYFVVALVIAAFATIIVCAVPQVPDVAKIALGSSVGGIVALTALHYGYSEWRDMSSAHRFGFALYVIIFLGTLAVMATPQVPNVAKIVIAGWYGGSAALAFGPSAVRAILHKIKLVALTLFVVALIVLLSHPQVATSTKLGIGITVGVIVALIACRKAKDVFDDRIRRPPPPPPTPPALRQAYAALQRAAAQGGSPPPQNVIPPPIGLRFGRRFGSPSSSPSAAHLRGSPPPDIVIPPPVRGDPSQVNRFNAFDGLPNAADLPPPGYEEAVPSDIVIPPPVRGDPPHVIRHNAFDDLPNAADTHLVHNSTHPRAAASASAHSGLALPSHMDPYVSKILNAEREFGGPEWHNPNDAPKPKPPPAYDEFDATHLFPPDVPPPPLPAAPPLFTKPVGLRPLTYREYLTKRGYVPVSDPHGWWHKNGKFLKGESDIQAREREKTALGHGFTISEFSKMDDDINSYYIKVLASTNNIDSAIEGRKKVEPKDGTEKPQVTYRQHLNQKQYCASDDGSGAWWKKGGFRRKADNGMESLADASTREIRDLGPQFFVREIVPLDHGRYRIEVVPVTNNLDSAM